MVPSAEFKEVRYDVVEVLVKAIISSYEYPNTKPIGVTVDVIVCLPQTIAVEKVSD